LDDATKAKLSIDFGLKVQSIAEGVLLDAGVQPGDILLELNLTRLNSVKDFELLAGKLPKQQKIPLRIVRGNRALFLPLVIR
jgi:serine protease Do